MTIAFSQLDEAPDPSSKRASRVADRIVRDILRAGWPVGTVLGGEAELLERYDVSRAVFRESVRLLEHLGVATTRRGPGGGLIVTAPSTTGVVQAFLVYLTHAGLTLADLTEARVCVERSVARLAAQRADDSDIAALRERAQADRSRDALDANAHNLLHTMVARAAKNPAAELFVDVLGRLNTRFSYPRVSRSAQREALERSGRAHEVLVDAITAGDVALAERRMGRHLEAIGEYLGRNPRAPSTLEWVLYSDGAEEEKLGSQVARSIIVDIVDRDWPIGEVIGSESELVARYNVSRSVLREAVRLLEHHQVAVMKRGPRGGLVVTVPSIEPIVRAAAVYLEYRTITAGDLMDLRRDLESDAVALASKRAGDTQIRELHDVLEADARAEFESPTGEDLHVRIAELSGNAAIALFVRVLVELTRLRSDVGRRGTQRRRAITSESDHAHQAIVAAITQRDAALARRRVVKHLDAMEPLLT